MHSSLDDKATGQSARAQKWLDQLCQVESRMLSNWEEFLQHRSEVQLRLQELSEAFRRKQDHQDDLEKCHRRLQQLSQSNEETQCRLCDLKTAVENGQQSLEGLRCRMTGRLTELQGCQEEQKRELAKVSEELLAEGLKAKRQSKAVAEELLRKMAELNQKLGENMQSVEEEASGRLEALRSELNGLAHRMEGKAEERCEAEERCQALRCEMREVKEAQRQAAEASQASQASQKERLKGLQESSAQLSERLEKLSSEAQAGKGRLERAESQVEELWAQRGTFEEQLERLREEVASKAMKESRAQGDAVAQLTRRLQGQEEQLERSREATEALRAADRARVAQVEELSRACGEELRQGFLAELDGCRAADRQLEDSLRRLDSRLESVSATASHSSEGVAEVKAMARDMEKSQLQTRELLELRNGELQELLERRAYESSAKLEALRLSDAERQRQLEQLALHCEGLRETRQGVQAEVDGCRSVERQLEEALRRLEGRMERAQAAQATCSEAVAEAKAFARELLEKGLRECRELMERNGTEMKELLEQQASETGSKMEALKLSDQDCHQQLDFLSRAVADLSESRRGQALELESCQSTERKLEDQLRRLETRLERLQQQAVKCNEGLDGVSAAQSATSETMEQKLKELKEQLKELAGELQSGGKEAKAQGELLSQLARKQELSTDTLQAGQSELRRGSEAMFRRQEQLERQGGEAASAVQALQLQLAERGQQLERLSQVCQELSEARRGMVTEVENCRGIQRQLEDALHRVDLRLESVSSVAAQCSGGLADAKAVAEKVRGEALREAAIGRETTEQALKELVERKCSELQVKLEALRQQGSEQHHLAEQLSEQRKGLVLELEQFRTASRQQEDVVRAVEARLERQALQLAQAAEGLVDAKGLARELTEKVAQRCRELVELRSIEVKDLVDQRMSETLPKLEALRAADSEQSQQLQQLNKAVNDLAESTRGSAAELMSCQSIDRKLEESLRRMDSRIERVSSVATQGLEGASELKSFAREAAEKTMQQCKEMLERFGDWKEPVSQLRSELLAVEKEGKGQSEVVAELRKQQQGLEEQVQRRGVDAATELQQLRGQAVEQAAQLERLAKGLEAEMKKGISADAEARTFDRRLEAALRGCEERLSNVEVLAREGLAEARGASEAAERGQEQLQGTAQELKVLAATASEHTLQLQEFGRLRVELSACQGLERQLEARVDRSMAQSAQCAEGLAELKASVASSERLLQQSREGLELRLAELKELSERRGGDLNGRLEALKAAGGEQGQQLEQLSAVSKGLSERLSEMRRGLMMELEKVQSVDRQHEEALRQCESRLEKLSAETSSGLSEARSLAQQGLDAAQQLTEQRHKEVKDLLEHSVNSLTPRLEALRKASNEQQTELEQVAKSCSALSEARRGLVTEVEKCQAAFRQLEDLLRHVESKLERQGTVALQCSEGLQELRAFARELCEKATAQWRQQLEAGQQELKELVERRATEALQRLEAEQKQRTEGLRTAAEQLSEARAQLLAEVERCQTSDRRLQESVGEAKSSARQTVEEQAQELRSVRNVLEELQRQLSGLREEGGERDTRFAGRLVEAGKEVEELRSGLEEQWKRQESLSSLSLELQKAQELSHTRLSKVSVDLTEQKEDLRRFIAEGLRKIEQKLVDKTSGSRVLGLVMEELEGVVRTVAQRELQSFQREALDSMEWKLERCVQWLHGANVKLGLNPQGTLFSTDRFKEMLFEEEPTTQRHGRPQSARVRSASRTRT